MLSEHIHIALASIRSARLRSLLTMTGVIVAVVSVVTIASLGEGVKHRISGQANSVGKDLITIRPGKLVNRDSGGNITGVNFLSLLSSSALTEKDFNSIKQDKNIETAVPFSLVSGAPTLNGQQFGDGFVMATNEKMPQVVSQPVEFGNFFDEDQNGRHLAVIGQGVAENLFKENVPVSKTMQIRGQDFVVSGVFEKVAVNPLNPEANFNNAVFIPHDSGVHIAGNDLKIYEILVRPKSKDTDGIEKAIAGINSNLKANHGGQEDFTVLKQDDMLAAADKILDSVNNTVSIMAAVALFVGGIGIMNIMLVSVSERKREIGIRKAVGATNHQIRTQFLVEAVAISLIGALIGLFLSVLVNLFFRIFTGLEPVIAWQVALSSVAVSVIVGIIFGMVPAIKASRKDPIDALRSF